MNVFLKWQGDGMWIASYTKKSHSAILIWDNEVYYLTIGFGDNPTEGEVEPTLLNYMPTAERPKKDVRKLIEQNLKMWVEEAEYF